MATRPQKEASLASQDSESSIPPQPDHQYRYPEESEIVDRFRVIKPLGFGGFAEVYHCQDLELERPVAVKVLTEEEERGLEETRAAARLKHPHIIRVIDVSPRGHKPPFIVFDYVEGQTLERLINEAEYRRLSLSEDSLRIARQVSQALDHAHKEGVIHRDVKPSNIILDNQRTAYLTDFGLAEVKRPPQGLSVHTTRVQHRLSGTIPYMAPEQLKDEIAGDRRSDIYSLGVVVYEMLTGQLPYRGRDASLIYQIATSKPIPPTLANPELPMGIEPVLLKALDKDPNERYPSCQAFAKELGEAAQAYVKASAQYTKARKFLDVEQWRRALAAFEALDNQAPGFGDTAHYLEQARHQVQLLGLYEKARDSLQQGQYEDTLSTLNVLAQLAPEFGTEDLRQRALKSLAQEEKRSLDEQYQQAVKQFEEENYPACLNTLAVIRERDSNYPDPEGIETPAQKHVENQQRVRALYTQGVVQMGQEQWEKAINTFRELQGESPDYEDVETRLTMARRMARVYTLLQLARAFLKQGDFAACVDKLGELQRIDAQHKKDEVAQIRQEALYRLHEQVLRSMQEGRFNEALTTLAELRERSSGYSDVDRLEAQAHAGIQTQNLRRMLDDMYDQMVRHLDEGNHSRTFDLWQAIQQQRGDLDYPDPLNVKVRIRDGLYGRAEVALAHEDPDQALKFWDQVREIDPDYPDNRRVAEEARALKERREKMRWWGFRLGGGAVGLLLVGILIFVISRGCGSPVVLPTDTPTMTPPPIVTSTVTPSPKSTLTQMPPSNTTDTRTTTPSPTTTPTQTPPPTPTNTQSPTHIPTSTTTPKARETAPQGSSIYVAPNSGSQVLGGISAGKEVLVLGRSAYGQWFYVRSDDGVEGFAYAPRFEWSGDYDSLLVIDSPPITPAPIPSSQYPSLEMDFWDIGSGRCSEVRWYKSIFIAGHGGNGIYTYYWKDERVAGPTSESYSFEISSMGGGAVIGVGKVVSGDGQQVERELYIRAADCAK